VTEYPFTVTSVHVLQRDVTGLAPDDCFAGLSRWSGWLGERGPLGVILVGLFYVCVMDWA
jgi:hypothetical protein